MSGLYSFAFGPTLYYRVERANGRMGRLYRPNTAESFADRIIQLSWIAIIPPFLMDYFKQSPVQRLVGYFGIIFSALGVAYTVKAYGRYNNADYQAFHRALHTRGIKHDAKANGAPGPDVCPLNEDELDSFDYEFAYRPIDFQSNKLAPAIPPASSTVRERVRNRGMTLVGVPRRTLNFVVSRAVGRPLMYPGSTWILRWLLRDQLALARAKLVEEEHGQRLKVQTVDGDTIDCMYFDRRGAAKSDRANTLVITCEGNASFYELRAGYSQLAFNRPGFGCSTGTPWPQIDANAVASVIDFAIKGLGWNSKNIVLYAWSIGGYTAARGALARPDISGVVLDATFDHVLPLAMRRMPAYDFVQGVVHDVVKTHLDVDVLGAIKQFAGPVLFVRRRRDEMISTRPGRLEWNRGNNLVSGFLAARYPKIVDEKYLLDLLAKRTYVVSDPGTTDEDEDVQRFLGSLAGQSPPYIYGSELDPGVCAKLTRWLLSKHLVDLELTHCDAMPLQAWRLPWAPVS